MNALKIYRLSRWFYLHKIPIFPKILSKLNTILFAVKIPYSIPIGKGTKFAAGGMCLNLNAKSIGDNCTIGTGCVMMRSFPYKELPKIGNNVYIGSNSTVIGNIQIGNNVIVGAGSVVVKNIPDNSVVVGNPARIIRNIYESDYNEILP